MNNKILNLKTLCFCFLMLAHCSCQHQETIHKSFPVSVNVSPELIPINEILKIGDIYKSDDYIILRNIEQNMLLYNRMNVYDLNKK